MFQIGNNVSKDPQIISHTFCKYFTEIGNKYVGNTPQAQKPYSCHLQNKNIKHSLFMTPTDPMDIVKIITSLKPKKKCRP